MVTYDPRATRHHPPGEAADRLRSEQTNLLEKVKKFQEFDLKKIEEAIAILSEALPREAELYGELDEFNLQAQKIGRKPGNFSLSPEGTAA
jgi:hypothetical protein